MPSAARETWGASYSQFPCDNASPRRGATLLCARRCLTKAVSYFTIIMLTPSRSQMMSRMTLLPLHPPHLRQSLLCPLAGNLTMKKMRYDCNLTPSIMRNAIRKPYPMITHTTVSSSYLLTHSSANTGRRLLGRRRRLGRGTRKGKSRRSKSETRSR